MGEYIKVPFTPLRIVFRRIRKNLGLAFKDEHEIHIRKGMNDEDTMYTVIHEGLHVEQWDLDETAVDRITCALGDALTRIFCFRRHEED